MQTRDDPARLASGAVVAVVADTAGNRTMEDGMIYTSDTIGKLAEALAAAQAEIEGATKDKANPHFRSKYADLGAVWDAWQAVGPRHGLAIVQMPGGIADGRMSLTTRMMHKSGEWIQETAEVPLSKQDAQGYGSANTYARRYALAAFAGIAPEDDDGEAAVGRAKAAPFKAPAAKAEPPVDPATLTVEDGANLEAARTWANQQALAIRNMDAEALQAWQREKRNQKALDKLEAADPANARTLREIIADRADYLAATGMGLTADGRAA